MTEKTLLSELRLIAQFKKLLLNEENKNQTLKEAYSKGNTILLNEYMKSFQEAHTNFEPIMADIDHFMKQKGLSQQGLSQAQLEQENFDKPNPSSEVVNNRIDQSVESNKEISYVGNNAVVPNIEIDVLILITNQKIVNYVKKTFAQPGIRFLHHLQDLKFENPTIIVRISASRNLDDKLEEAIQYKRPKKSVTMILLSQGSVPVSDKEIMVPNTQTKINALTFLYNDKLDESPFRREDFCETKGIFKISDVFEFIRCNKKI